MGSEVGEHAEEVEQLDDVAVAAQGSRVMAAAEAEGARLVVGE